MASYTSFLNLEKPTTSERLDVLKINSNWDKIDAGVSALNSQLGQVKMKSSYGNASTGTVTLSVPSVGRYGILFFAANMVGIIKYEQELTMFIMGEVPSGWTITDNKDVDRTMTITRTNSNSFSWGLISMV